MWRPNKRQWPVIVICIAGGLLGARFGAGYGPFFATMAMLIGGLLVWKME